MPFDVIKIILGLVAILALAYLGGHPRVQEWESRLRIATAVTAGFPFVLIGLVASLPSVGVLTDDVLREVRPILPLGLGWIGFAIGFRFDVRLFEGPRAGIGAAVVLLTAFPFIVTVAACAPLFLAERGLTDATFLRDAVVLGTAGAVTARGLPGLLAARRDAPSERVSRLVQIEELAAVSALAVLAAFFRPYGIEVGWHLPGTAWLFVTLGLATAVGALVYGLLQSFHDGAEITVVLLGSICFTAGLAGYLRLSPLVVCTLAGVLLANFPGAWKEQVRGAILRLERPIYLLFLVLAGALWRVGDWQGWALMGLFVLARLLGKRLGATLLAARAPEAFDPDERRALSVAPLGALAVAIVVNAQDLYFGPTISWLVTAILGGAIATEIAVQVLARRAPAG